MRTCRVKRTYYALTHAIHSDAETLTTSSLVPQDTRTIIEKDHEHKGGTCAEHFYIIEERRSESARQNVPRANANNEYTKSSRMATQAVDFDRRNDRDARRRRGAKDQVLTRSQSPPPSFTSFCIGLSPPLVSLNHAVCSPTLRRLN